MMARMVRAKRTRLPLGVSFSVGSLGAFAVGLTAAASGCGGSAQVSSAAKGTPSEGPRSEALDHEACDESGHRVETMDTNNDGKPDIRRYFDNKTGKEACRVTDLDHDGRPDLFEYYDASGALRRREAAYDGSGVVDAVEVYANGKLAKRELDTTGQHRIDTWDYYDSAGKLLRRERDSTNDGRIDQWWTYDGAKVTIAIDRNGDGKPDPQDSVTFGATDQQAATTSAPAAATADAGPAAAPAPYVPAGMDAGDLAVPSPQTTEETLGDASAPESTKKKGSKK